MSNEYYTRDGDTFEIISRNVYGTEQNAKLIEDSNPPVTQPIQPDTFLFIPDDPAAPVNSAQKAPSEGENETSLFIRGRRFRFWTKVVISRSIDNIDQVAVLAPFKPDDKAYRDSFRPFKYDPIEVNIDGEPLFTGRIVPVRPVLSNAGNSVSISGYSKPGILTDSTAPASKAPLEFLDMNLKDIAKTLAAPFGIGVEFEVDSGPSFEQVAMTASEKVMPFLVKLATQRNLVISSTPRGNLIFRQSVEALATKAVAVFEQGESPLFKIVPSFNEQDYYSSITGTEATFLFFNGGKITVDNPFLTDIQRPLTFLVPDTQGGDLQAAVEAKMGRMFANMASYVLTVPTWRDPDGNLWEPNTVVIVRAPGVMIYEQYKFIVRRVQLTREGNTESASLELILPGGFSGSVPDSLPWE